MANFAGMRTKNGKQIWINLDLVTDFYYDAEKDETTFGIVGEENYRHFHGDLTDNFMSIYRGGDRP